MNKFFKSWQLTAVILVSLFAVSCGKDDTPEPQGGKGKILVETTVKNQDGLSGSSYIQLVPEIKGDIDNESAIQVDFSATVSVWGNDVFVTSGFSKDASSELKKFTYKKDDYLGTPEELPLPTGAGALNVVKVSDEKVYMPMFNVGKVWIINPKTMKKTGEIDLVPYAHGDNNPDASYGFIRDGLYYLPLAQVDANWQPQADHLQVDVAIIDTETDKVLKVASETQSGLCFPTRPMLKNMIFTDEQEDLYITCVGFFGFNPGHLNSGFACIPAGKQEFDVSKSWDVSTTTVEGTEYKPASIMNTKYIGNGKVAAFVTILELTGQNPYTSKNNMAVLMDLKAKTIKKIEGVPLTDGHSILIEEHNGEVIFGVYGKKKIGFFTYNPTTGDVTHEANTVGNPTFVHFFE